MSHAPARLERESAAPLGSSALSFAALSFAAPSITALSITALSNAALGLAALGLLVLPMSAARAADVCYAPETLKMRPGEEIVRPQPPATRPSLPELRLPAAKAVPAGLSGSIRRVDLPPGMKRVALTFDLCEASGEVSGYDGALFDYLREQGVEATLFVGGKWMMTHPERSRQLLADPLFEVGNHTWSHGNLAVRSGEAMRRQVDDADTAIALRRTETAKACTLHNGPAEGRTQLFRFPFGSCSADSLGYVNETGHLAIQWDVDSADPAFLGAKLMAANMLREIRPGSIVLMHANGRGKHTAEALRILIPELKARGYSFSTVSDLIAAGRPVIAATCYSMRPGDTRVYDEAARAGKRILPVQ